MDLANGKYKAKIKTAQAIITPTGTPGIACMFDLEVDGQIVSKKYTAWTSEKALPYSAKMLLGAGVSEKEFQRIENGEQEVEIALPLEVSATIENEPSKDGTKMYANIKSIWAGGSAGLGEVAEKNAFKQAMGGMSLVAAAKAEVKLNPSLASVKNAAAALSGKPAPKFDTEEPVPF